MATFKFGRQVNIHWNGFDVKGPADTVFSIPDQLYEEFESDIRGVEPSLTWIDTNEFQTLTNEVSTAALSATFPVAIATSTTGKTISLSSSTNPNGYLMVADGSGGVIFTPASTSGLTSVVGVSPISAIVQGGTVSVSLTANYQTAGSYQPAGTYVTGVVGTSPISASGTTSITVTIDQALITGATAAENAETLRHYVKNTTGTTIPLGSAVYISGATGDNALISLATASTEVGSSKTLGLTAESIANDAFGYVIEAGYLAGIDTTSTTAGASVWLGNTPGSLVFGSPPAEPSNSVYLGIVIREQLVNGSLLVKVQNGYELDELHDVYVGGVSTALPLVYSSASTGWVAQALTSVGIADDAVVGSKILDGAVTSSKIAASAVGSSALADNAVVAAKIAAAAVGTSKISSGSASAGLVLASDGIGGVAFTTAAAGFNGPASSIDNTIARFDGTGGTTVQGSKVVINDSEDVFFPAAIGYSPVSVSLSSNTYTLDLSTGIFFGPLTAGTRIDPTFITSSSVDFGAATSGLVTIPSGCNKGDTVITAIGTDGGTAVLNTSQVEGSPQKIGSYMGGASGGAYAYVFMSTLSANNQTSIGTFTGLLTASTAVTHVYRGVATWDYIQFAGSTTGMPNPPAAAASGTAARTIVAMGFLDDDNVTATAPAGYSNIVSQSSSATGFTTMICSADLTSTTQDPGAFGGTGTDDWAAATLVLVGSLGDRTVTLTNPPTQAISGFADAKAHTVAILVSPAADGVLTWDSKINWAGSGIPSSDVSSVVVLTTYDGLTYYGTYSAFQ